LILWLTDIYRASELKFKIMILLITCLLFICFESVTEALIKMYCPKLSKVIFLWWLQWIIAIALFGIWLFAIALPFDGYYVPVIKLILGFIFVRFLIFDFAYNITSGLPLMFYGTTKWYDRIMKSLGNYGIMWKVICGIIGIIFLFGKS
jgi:hypothetical protein